MSERSTSALSLAELGAETGESPERLLEWRSRALIGSADQDTYVLADVERVQVSAQRLIAEMP